jgi:hypothetical protein
MLLSRAILARDQVKGSPVDVIVQWDPERGIISSNSNDEDEDAMDKSNYTQRIPAMFTSDGHTRRNGKCICKYRIHHFDFG